MSVAPALVEVAVGLVSDRAGRLLLAQRPAGKPYAGWWEFPGGKLEPGESVGAALARELDEELGLVVHASQPWIVRQHVYPHAHVRLHFRRVFNWSGTPRSREGQAFCWVWPQAIDRTPLLPASIPILRMLALPRRLVGLSADASRRHRRTARSPIAGTDQPSPGCGPTVGTDQPPRPRALYVLAGAGLDPKCASPGTSEGIEALLARLRATPGTLICVRAGAREQLVAQCDGILATPTEQDGWSEGLRGLLVRHIGELELLREACADFAVVALDVGADFERIGPRLTDSAMPIYILADSAAAMRARGWPVHGIARGRWATSLRER